MSPLIETIKLKDGKLYNLEYHTRRFLKACRNYFGVTADQNLLYSIKIPEDKKQGLYRCRIIYSPKIEKIEFIPHEYRKIQKLRLIEDNHIDYQYKYLDRSSLETLFDKKGDCDDIIIVKKDCLTDSFTANILFFDGQNWYTPDTPLLKGTQREKLIHEKQIFECRITPSDLCNYKTAGLINALQDLEEMPVIEINSITI